MRKIFSFQDFFNNITFILLSFCIVFSTLLCGSPLNNNTVIVNILLNIIAIGSIIINNIIYRKKISFSKFDFIILLISFMYVIPIIFNSYCSISDTFDYFLRYISIFSVYIIIKNMNLDKQKISIILNIIVISSLLVIILGIDDMSTHCFDKLDIFLSTYSSPLASDVRLDSVFEYPNAFASLVNISCFIAIGLFCKSRNKFLKSIYAGIINLEIIALILSGSRLNIAIFLFVLFILILLLHKKNTTIELVELFFIILFASLFYCTNYLNLITSSKYGVLWIGFLLEFIIVAILYYLISLINNKLYNISLKKFIIITLLILLIIFLIFIVLLQIPDSLTLFDTDNITHQKTIKQLNYIKPNENYIFEFNLDSFSSSSLEETFSIRIFELNENFENLKVHSIKFGNYTGWKSCDFKTTSDTRFIKIVCRTTQNDENTRLTISDFYLNNKRNFINYKFLPTTLIFRFEKILSGDNSLKERFIFIEDGFKIISEHIFTGSGANGWRYKFKNIQTEDYYTTEVHSYPIQLFIEVGILGIVAYIVLLFYTFIIVYKNLKKGTNNTTLVSLFSALLSVFLHSCIDFDMSFFSILLQFYLIIFIIKNNYDSNSKNTTIQKNISNIVILICFLFILLYSTFLNIGNEISKGLYVNNQSLSAVKLANTTLTFNKYNKYARLTKITNNKSHDLIKEYELFIKYEPFYDDIDFLKISYVVNILKTLDQNNYENILEKINQINYSDSFFLQYVFRQNTSKILKIIEEKRTKYPNINLDNLYNKYLTLSDKYPL